MPKVRRAYECEFCGAPYNTIQLARDCEFRGFHPKLKVGDIVLARGGFGWYDGDRRWIVNPDVEVTRSGHDDDRNCFDDCCCYSFYYVVTKVDGAEEDAHRPRYHLLTKAMSGNSGWRTGWTYDEHHINPEPVAKPPAFIVEDSRDVLGQEASGLL